MQSGSQYSYTPPVYVHFEKVSKRICLDLRMEKEGCYQAIATYKGVKLKNADFTIIVLNGEIVCLVPSSLLLRHFTSWIYAHSLGVVWACKDRFDLVHL